MNATEVLVALRKWRQKKLAQALEKSIDHQAYLVFKKSIDFMYDELYHHAKLYILGYPTTYNPKECTIAVQ